MVMALHNNLRRVILKEETIAPLVVVHNQLIMMTLCTVTEVQSCPVKIDRNLYWKEHPEKKTTQLSQASFSEPS